MENLEGKVALITGATSGIGYAIAEQLSASGADLMVTARNRENFDVFSKISLGGRIKFATANVADYLDCMNLVEMTIEEYGRIDILVNNAGCMANGPIGTAKLKPLINMVRTNLEGPIVLTTLVLPYMLEQGVGDIVNISSLSSRRVSAESAVYSATKSALNVFSEGVRKEVCKKNIRVFVVEPGHTKTNLSSTIEDPEVRRRHDERMAAMNRPEPQDIADAVIFALTRPRHVLVGDILIVPTEQE